VDHAISAGRMKVVQTIANEDGTRRVEIYRRDRGTFGFRELRWDPVESSWVSVGRYAESFSDSVDHTLLEARSRVPWLATLR
jgi:hypothetical protein